MKSFAAGVVTGAAAAGAAVGLAWYLTSRSRRNSGHSRADWSLFYGYRSDAQPSKTTSPKDTTEEDEKWLRRVPQEYRRIPSEVYGALVRTAVVTCVDVVLKRPDGCCLLVYRGMEPCQAFWWFPGGRMFKGETFFDTAVRKIKEEAGIDCKAEKVLGVWNAFYPTSSWDKEGEEGRFGTQTVNAVVVCEVSQEEGESVKIDATSEEFLWVKISDILRLGEELYDRYLVESLKLL
uniref:Nudix hydrolase domain-containing protein n=1 Tax=Pinguiococcus pyrenoidosus TaxID=172671 RepID=A0A7R9U4V7_9STRA|mmetsp:Transcript_12779/g.47209  ORF Transcript_12779/g.47209 Transcript_12779/m.47209 type:complete len:235 (+) Transcript_12779:1380-2084(+)